MKILCRCVICLVGFIQYVLFTWLFQFTRILTMSTAGRQQYHSKLLMVKKWMAFEHIQLHLYCYASAEYKQRHRPSDLGIIVTSHERHGMSYHRQLRCLFSRLFRRTSNKTSKPRVSGYLWPVDSLHKGAVMRKMFPCHGVVMEMSFISVLARSHPTVENIIRTTSCQIGKLIIKLKKRVVVDKWRNCNTCDIFDNWLNIANIQTASTDYSPKVT